MKVKPMSPTKLASIERLLVKMSEFFQEIEKIEKIKSGENMVSMLKAVKDIFSESIEDFKFLDLDDKLLALAQQSFKSGILCMRILKKKLKK
ncbi:MAG: hypothetical protein HW401_425, partial [Parcubacteria group bacterium]|nr:hypothetical protein [Parcubacteria group bacterium]